MNKSDRTLPTGSALTRVKRADCDEMRALEAELTLAFKRFSAALRASRERGLMIGDAETEAAGACIVQAWAALGAHNARHRCQ